MRRILPLLLALSGAQVLSAQLVRPNVRVIDTRDGLSHDQVNALVKDHRGYLWAATGDGLSRFSGSRMVVYRTNGTPGSIPNDHINDLAIDRAGLLYIGSDCPFLTILDPFEDTLISVPLPGTPTGDVTDDCITSLYIDHAQRLWIGHGRRNLSLFDRATRTWTTFAIATPAGHPQGRNWIRSMLLDADGILWLGTEFGLVRFNPQDHTYHSISMRGIESADPGFEWSVEALVDGGPSLLVGAYGGGVFRLDKSTGTFTPLLLGAAPWHTMLVKDLQRVDDERVLIATQDQGLISLDPTGGAVKYFDRSIDPEHDRVPSLLHGSQTFLQDGDDLWVGTAQDGIGLIAARQNSFRSIPLAADFSVDDGVTRSAIDPITGHFLVLTYRSGLFIMDSTGAHVAHIPTPWPGDRAAAFLDLLVADDGVIWVATNRRTLLVDRQRRRFFPHPRLSEGSPCGGFVWNFYGAGDQALWIKTGTGALVHLDTLSWIAQDLQEFAPLTRSHVAGSLRALLVDSRGRIWIGHDDRPTVVILPDKTVRVVPKATASTSGMPDVFVTGLAEGLDGTIWASTYTHGLVGLRLEADGSVDYTSITTEQGMPSNTIYSVVAAFDGALWGGTKSGMYRFDPKTRTATSFSSEHGLPRSDLNGSFELDAESGHILYGEVKGLVYFDPMGLRPSPSPPMVQIPAISTFDRLLVHNADLSRAALSLHHEQHQVRFALRSTNLVDPGNDRFAYRLLSSDTAWTIVQAQDEITFSHLEPASYTFEVKARTGNGAWGAVTRVAFIILPPWWATWWFRALVGLAVFVLIYSGSRTYLYMRLRRQRALFEREQAITHERIRIASDMHDDLGSGLSAIKLNSEVALMSDDPTVRAQSLREAASGADELLGNMRQIVWALGSDQGSLADLLAYTRSFAVQYLDKHGIVCDVRIPGAIPMIELSVDERRNIFLIVKEALHNVVRHAKAGEVIITVQFEGGLHLNIVDDGTGLPLEATNGGVPGNGMRTMRNRAESLSGVFRISRMEPRGTSLEVIIPLLALAHQHGDRTNGQ